MRFLPVNQLREGMILGQELQDASGRMLLEKNTRLSKDNISYISFLEVTGLYIADDFSKDVAQSSKLGLRMTMTIIPIIGLIIAIIVFRKKFILTEEKMNEIGEELKARKG